MAGELVERLRKPWDGTAGARARRDVERAEAADRIEALERENATLRAALEPFAAEAEKWAAVHGDDLIPNLTPSVTEACDRELAAFTVGDLRRAAAIRNMGGEG